MNGARFRYRSRYGLVEWTPKDSRGKRVWSVSSSLFLRSSTVCMLLEGYADYDVGEGILDAESKRRPSHLHILQGGSFVDAKIRPILSRCPIFWV